MTSKEKTSKTHYHTFMSVGSTIYQDQKTDDKFEAIDLFLKLANSMYKVKDDPVLTELALIKMIDQDTFIGTYLGDYLKISCMPCIQCSPVLYN